jgi:hypothetical protein
MSTKKIQILGNLTKYTASDSAPEDTDLLWIDTTDTTSDFEPLIVDTTLTNRGEAAESKAVGDKIKQLTSEIDELNVNFTEQIDATNNELASQVSNLNNEFSNQISNLSKKLYVQSTPPTDVVDGTMWVDLSEE